MKFSLKKKTCVNSKFLATFWSIWNFLKIKLYKCIEENAFSFRCLQTFIFRRNAILESFYYMFKLALGFVLYFSLFLFHIKICNKKETLLGLKTFCGWVFNLFLLLNLSRDLVSLSFVGKRGRILMWMCSALPFTVSLIQRFVFSAAIN